MDQKDSASLLDAPLRVSTQRCHQLLCAHAEMQSEAGCLKILHLPLDAKEGAIQVEQLNLMKKFPLRKDQSLLRYVNFSFRTLVKKLLLVFVLEMCATLWMLLLSGLLVFFLWSIQWMQEACKGNMHAVLLETVHMVVWAQNSLRNVWMGIWRA